MTDDRQLLDDYVGHRSQEAFAELVRRHLSLVYFTALRRVGNNRALAEDVAQSVFIALARKAAEVRHRPVLAGWLYTSARFAAAQAVRAERRRAKREREAQALQMIDAADSPGESPLALLDDALDRLPDADREMVLLRFQESRGFSEVGARYGLSADGARRRVERAVDRMRRILERRGITSTAMALGSVLAARAADVAPAALAPRIASAAFTGVAAASWGAGGWKAAVGAAGWKLVVGLATLTCVGGGLAVRHAAERYLAAERTPAKAPEGSTQPDDPALPAESSAARSGAGALAGSRLGHYMPAQVQLANLERIVTTLTPAQRQQALQIYLNLTDIMDSLDPATRPDTGAASRGDAWSAVRALLTAKQRKLYDAHPTLVQLGYSLAPQRRAILTAVISYVRASPGIAAIVGQIHEARVVDGATQSFRRAGGPPVVVQGYMDVWVMGDEGTNVVKVYWTMDKAGRVTITHFQAT